MALEQVLATIARRIAALEARFEALLEPTNSCCLLSDAGPQTISTATPAAVTFGTEDRDQDDLHVGASPTRITIKVAGVYSLMGGTTWVKDATGVRRVSLGRSGVVLARHSHDGNATENHMTIGCTALFTVGQYAQLFAYQDSGGDLNISNSWLTATRIA